MYKYVVIIILGIAFIVVALSLNKIFKDKSEGESITLEYTEKVESGEILNPDMVRVTYGDSLYHDETCNWIGSGSKRMSLDNAKAKGFYSCPYCMPEE